MKMNELKMEKKMRIFNSNGPVDGAEHYCVE